MDLLFHKRYLLGLKNKFREKMSYPFFLKQFRYESEKYTSFYSEHN